MKSMTKMISLVRTMCVTAIVSLLAQSVWAASWSGDLQSTATDVFAGSKITFADFKSAMPAEGENAFSFCQGSLGGSWMDSEKPFTAALVKSKSDTEVVIQYQLIDSRWVKLAEVTFSAASDNGISAVRSNRGSIENRLTEYGALITSFDSNNSQAADVYTVKSVTVVLPKEDVTFTVANATDWENKTLPKAAMTTSATGNISFAGNDDYLQSLGGLKNATVAHVSNVSNTANIFGLTSTDQGNGSGAITRDVYLKVSGGAAGVITGGEDANWEANSKTIPTGNVLVNVAGNTAVNYVYGAGMGGGKGGSTLARIEGNVGVVIEGNAQVKYDVVGGWQSRHNAQPKVSGNTSVLIKNVQTNTGNIIGGGCYNTNHGGGLVTGNSSVTVSIANSETGTFAKSLIGGAWNHVNNQYNNQVVNGNSSVSIAAPNAVTFSGDIVGGGHNGNRVSSSVGGNASVTINGGTYTGTIYAGGDNGTYTPVTGTATLTLQAGDFSGATLKGGQATGTKTLVAVGAVTLTPTQISGFDTIVAREGGALTLNVASDTAMSNIATEGTGYIVKAGAGTLDVGSLRPRMDVQAGKIKLLASGDDIAAGYINLPIPVTASEGDADKVLVVDANGETIQLNGTPVVDTTAGIVRINLQVNTVISTTGNLSASIQDSSSGLFLIQGPATGTPIEITIDCATPDAVTYQVSGLVKFILANGQSLMSLDKFAFEEGSELILDASCAGTITVPADKAITIGGGTYTIVNNGTVRVKGDTTVTLTNNDTGVFDVVSGNASVNAPANQTVKGTIYVRSDATFTNVRTSDAIAYDGTINIHVYGTLAFGATRWTFGANNNLYLYTGATVTGTGDGGNGALDFNGGNGNIFVKPNGSTTGTVTCSAPMRNRQGGTINVDANMTFETTGNLISYGDGKPTKAGDGMWTIKGGDIGNNIAVNAGTLKLVAINLASGKAITMAGGTLQLAQNEANDAYTFTGTVSSQAIGNGTILASGSTVTLSGTFTNYSGWIKSSDANSKFIIPAGQEVTIGEINAGSKIEIEGTLVHKNSQNNTQTVYQGKNLSGLTGNGTFKIAGVKYFFTCGTSNINNYWASTLAICNERGDATAGNDKGIVWGQPNNANATISIGTLSGHGMMRTDANSGNRNLKVTQAADSEWSGVFCGGDRLGTFIVAGKEGATAKTLTLSGSQNASDRTDDLTIEATGSVKLTGAWKAETVTVNGRLEVLDTATLTKTTLTSAGSMKTADSTVYFGSDEIASAEAAAKAGTTYYATIADAVAAATLADITVINASAEVPAGYAKVTTGDVVTLRQVGGKVYYKDGAWSDGCTVWADAAHTATTTFNVADTMVLDTNNTVVYPNKDITSALKIEIAAGITAVIGHDNYLTANPYNVPDNSVITLGDGAHLGVTFWNNTTDHTPAFGTVTINGGTFGVYNVTSKAINAGTIKGTSQLVLNEGETITVSGSIETTPISGVDHKHVVCNEGVYSLAMDQVTISVPSIDNTTVAVTGGTIADNAVVVDYGTAVTVTYTANENYKLVGGDGVYEFDGTTDGEAGTGLSAVLDVTTITIPPVANMTAAVVDGNGQAITISESNTITVTIGSTFTVTYTPNNGYVGEAITLDTITAAADTVVTAPTKGLPVAANSVAKIGNTGYETLGAAVEVGGVIELLQDVTENVTIAEGKTVTLTGAYTITPANTAWYTIDVKGTLTIDGVTVNGVAATTAGNPSAIRVGWDSDAEAGEKTASLMLKSGAVVGGLNSIKGDSGAAITIAGGSITHSCTITGTAPILNYGTLSITGGTITANSISAKPLINAGNGTATISGGTFIAGAIADTYLDMLADGYNLHYTKGGTVTVSTETTEFPTLLKVVGEKSYTYYCTDLDSVKAKTCYYIVNGLYMTSTPAFKAGNTVKLACDVSQGISTMNYEGMVLDLNTHTLASTKAISLGKSMTITNGTLSALSININLDTVQLTVVDATIPAVKTTKVGYEVVKNGNVYSIAKPVVEVPVVENAAKYEVSVNGGAATEHAAAPSLSIDTDSTLLYAITAKDADGNELGTTEIGVIAAKAAEAGSKPARVTTAVAVPFTGATVANLLNTALLKEGDTLTAQGKTWTLNANKTWIGTYSATTALARGTAVWVMTAGKIVVLGKYDENTEIAAPTTAETHLLANPTMRPYTPTIESTDAEDQVMMVGEATPTRFTKKNGTWTKSAVKKYINGNPVYGDVTEDPVIPVGKGFWFIKK